MTTHPFLDHEGVLAFAHRGGAGDWPENTMPAFQAAIDLGYKYIETDAYCTRDGVLLAFHDDRLDRVTDRTGLIEKLDYSEVAAARVDGTEPIPLLEDVLSGWRDVRVNIDPKHDAAVGPLIDAIKRTGAIDRICVGSFSGRRLARLRAALGPNLCTSMGPIEVFRLWLRARGLPVPLPNAQCAQLPVQAGRITLIEPRLIETAHRAGLQVHVWTIDDADEMNRLIDLGVDGLMTDRPKVLKRVLEEREKWSPRAFNSTS